MKILFFFTPETKEAAEMELMLAGMTVQDINMMDANNIGMIISYHVHTQNAVIVINKEGHQKRMITPAEVNEWRSHVRQM